MVKHDNNAERDYLYIANYVSCKVRVPPPHFLTGSGLFRNLIDPICRHDLLNNILSLNLSNFNITRAGRRLETKRVKFKEWIIQVSIATVIYFDYDELTCVGNIL